MGRQLFVSKTNIKLFIDDMYKDRPKYILWISSSDIKNY